jgi:hypothetical protein
VQPLTTDTQEISGFTEKLNGLLYSLLSWKQLAEFWPRINTGAGWYIYAIGEPVPDTVSTAEQVAAFIKHVDELLHKEHHEDYCGIVYADDLNNPGFIKIYDPNNLGVSCGSSKNPPLPGWILSTIPPTELQPKGVIPANRKRWWQTFLSLGN